jgi:LuxR family maltose regulon positive regulatory protein
MNETSSACTEEGGVHEPWADKRAPADGTPFNSGSPDIHGSSASEFQILQLIAEGQMNKEIARSSLFLPRRSNGTSKTSTRSLK